MKSKNIHVLSTTQKSKIFFNHNKGFEKYQFSKEPFINGLTNTTNQNIYITNDEEIKIGDWFLPQGHINPHKLKGYNKINGDLESYNGLCYDISKCKKIILTTDQDLIKDGIQAIDDESLEWFVKNPSCENIDFEIINDNIKWYKIIIPKEEPKKLYDLPLAVNNVTMSCTSKPKQETLEEASEKYENSFYEPNGTESVDFISGAKWQKEQDNKMYSEGDVRKAIRLARLCTLDNVTGEFIDLSGLTEVCTYGLQETHSEDSIIEQFKKK